MAEKVFILGDSGTGKSTSIRNLNPKETFIIQCENKRLPFKGWKSKYQFLTTENTSGNLSCSTNYLTIEKQLLYISERRPEIKTIIIDDANYLMTEDFMSRIPQKEVKGDVFAKYNQIAYSFYHLLGMIGNLRDDLIVIFMAHTQLNDDGRRSFKTIGKLLDEKIVLEGKVTIILETCMKDKKYLFQTNKIDGSEPCKSPMGMFEDLFIENDLQIVIDKIKEYDN